ncbi:MAG: hypothetical protein V1907_04380 [Candidatus Kerfeldbacteria bacterium]
MKMKFLSSGAKILICFLALFAILDVYTIYNLHQAKPEYLKAVAPYTVLILIIIAVYSIINAFFKNSRNIIIRSLKNFSARHIIGFSFFIISLFYLYDLVFHFHNIETTGSAFYFTAFTLWNIFYIVVALGFLAFKDKTLSKRMSKLNYIYWLGIANQNVVFKITTAFAYALFLLYSAIFLLTVGIPITTKGTIVGVSMESGSLAIYKYKLPDFYTQYNIVINDGGKNYTFLLSDEEGKKCNWEKANQVTIKHHIFWYTAVWNNRVIECN